MTLAGRSFGILLAVIIGLPAGQALAGKTDTAVSSYKAGNFKQAYTQFRPLAESGDAAAQYYLGVMYANGQGVTNDYRKAASWITLAAKQGHPQAQYMLSVLYTAGLGVPKDKAKAAYWHQQFRRSHTPKNGR